MGEELVGVADKNSKHIDLSACRHTPRNTRERHSVDSRDNLSGAGQIASVSTAVCGLIPNLRTCGCHKRNCCEATKPKVQVFHRITSSCVLLFLGGVFTPSPLVARMDARVQSPAPSEICAEVGGTTVERFPAFAGSPLCQASFKL